MPSTVVPISGREVESAISTELREVFTVQSRSAAV